jgi:sugar phosphate isomerase/epimerase
VTGRRTFGISTHLHHNERLTREHVVEIGAHGFEAVEVFATRTHFDYHSEAAVADLQRWLAEAGLSLHGVHAPIGQGFAADRWGARLTLASTDPDRRALALAEAERALLIARRIPFNVLVAHVGLPRTQSSSEQDNNLDAARRSIEHLSESAAHVGVQVALEVIPNELSRAHELVRFVENMIEGSNVGICLDFGHAHMDGDVVEAIETVAEHLVTTHVHDNRGRTDDHLVPFEGTIDWPAALTAVQKVGYEGTLLLEIAAHGSATDTLIKAQRARERMERLLAVS